MRSIFAHVDFKISAAWRQSRGSCSLGVNYKYGSSGKLINHFYVSEENLPIFVQMYRSFFAVHYV